MLKTNYGISYLGKVSLTQKKKRLIIMVSLFNYLFVPKLFSHSYKNLFLNQVHRGNHFCHRMLNLNPARSQPKQGENLA